MNLVSNVGPLWDVTVGYALRSETLFIDRFYLVVPLEKVTFFQLLLVPFVPFAVKTWLYIIFLIIYMVIVLNIIHTGGVLNEKGTIGSRVCNIMYHAANSFASGSATDTTDDPTTAEKVVIGGFAVAMLIILTAYTATSAAAIVLGDTAKFSNLADVVARPNSKLCILDLAYAPFLHQHPETVSVLRKVNASTSFGMLQNMSFGFCKENDAYCCDAVVMHDDAYQTAVMYDVKYCEEMEMIYDEELLDIDNVIYISAKLHEYADSFIERANLLIDAQTYASTHSLYKQNLTGIAASIPSYEPFPGAVLHNSRCPKEEEDPGGNDFNLKPESLVFPLAVSALASTFGLLLYASQCHVWVAVKAKVGTELDDDDAHLALRANIEMMTPSKIIQELESSDVNRAQLSAAVNMLPDKSGLVDLMFQNSCSLYSINRGMVYSSLSVSDLYFLVKYCHASPDLTSIYVTDDMLDDDDVKDVLVQALMRYPRNRRLAITCARTKNEMGDELFSLFRFLGLEDDEITTESTNLIEGLNMEEITLSLSEMNRKKTNERIQGRSMISLDLENGSHYSGVQ